MILDQIEKGNRGAGEKEISKMFREMITQKSNMKAATVIASDVTATKEDRATAQAYITRQLSLTPSSGQRKTGSQASPLPTPKTEAERVAIPKGQWYLGPNGQALQKR